jgi:hypothetical protein
MEGFPGQKRRKRPKLTPEDIQKARRGDNLPLLRAAGRKGAEVTNTIKQKKKEERESIEEYYLEKDMLNLKKATNADITPLNPDDQEETI